MEKRYHIVYHPLAEKEYLESISWYEDNLTGLGNSFISEIEKTLSRIEINPFLYAVKKRSFREAHVQTFPYVIIYKINRKQKKIMVVSVFHASRNPVFKYKG
jgi:mRNA-degrading endonuclease RelE of RelBE toxin-antitoxin system